jgi:integrase/recombinase XerD
LVFLDLAVLYTVQNGLKVDGMSINTHSEHVNILKYVKVAGKWRFAPVVKRANGGIRWDHVLISGVDEHHPEGKYYIEWRDPDRERKSVGSVPSEVMSEAQRKRAYLDAKAAGLDVVSKEERPLKRQRLITDAVDRYLRDVEMNKANSTYTHYRHCMSLFKQSLVKTSLEEIDRDDLMDFQAFLYRQGLSARTVKHKTTIVASFLKTAGVEKLLNKGDWPSYTEEDPESYTKDELEHFFRACSTEEFLLFQFFLHSGFRDKEVRHIQWSDIDFLGGVAKVKRKEGKRPNEQRFEPKNKRPREVPLPDFLLNLLKAAQSKSRSRLCFPSRAHWKAPAAKPGGKPSDEFLEDCKGIALRAGLNCGDCENSAGEICAVAPCCEHFYLHKFRATFATMHLQSGVDILTVSSWLGHGSVKTTMRYLTAARGEDVRKKVNAGLMASAFSTQAIRPTIQNRIEQKLRS